MRVLVVGAGRNGVQVLRQLMKNPEIEIVILDPRERPFAVEQGVIKEVDLREALTPLTLELVIEQAKPDLILLTATTEDLGLGNVAGLDVLASALREEVASISNVPVIQVARTAEA